MQTFIQEWDWIKLAKREGSVYYDFVFSQRCIRRKGGSGAQLPLFSGKSCKISVFWMHSICWHPDIAACRLPGEMDFMTLRVRAFFHKTVRVCHVYCNFKIGCTCRITVIFGTLKDGSLLINTLASNICFSYRNMFQNGVDTLSKIVDAFLSKSSKFYLVRISR